MMANTIKVYNRRLEQVLFWLGYEFLSCDKTEQGMTVWTYPNNEEVRGVVTRFNETYQKRKERGW